MTTSTLPEFLTNPYFLHPSEISSQVIVQPSLIDKNYHTWSHSIKLALITKKKMGFISGIVKKPPIEDSKHDLWIQVDALIRGWILNLVSLALLKV